MIVRNVVASRSVAVVQACHKDTTRRRADRTTGIGLYETQTFTRQFVDIWRLNKFLAIILVSLFSLIPGTLYAEKYAIITTHEPPLNFSIGDISHAHGNQVTGFTTDIVREILKRTNNTTVIELLPWARGYRTIQKEKNVFLFSMSRSEERENKFKWIGPIAFKKQLLFAKKGSGIVINSLEDATGHEISGHRFSACEQNSMIRSMFESIKIQIIMNEGKELYRTS